MGKPNFRQSEFSVKKYFTRASRRGKIEDEFVPVLVLVRLPVRGRRRRERVHVYLQSLISPLFMSYRVHIRRVSLNRQAERLERMPHVVDDLTINQTINQSHGLSISSRVIDGRRRRVSRDDRKRVPRRVPRLPYFQT